jgi:hypothetical protein
MPSQVSVAGVAGVALLVAGVILIVASSVPIPYVESAPREVSLLNETFVVGAREALARCFEPFPPGTTLHIAVKVLSGGDRTINFWVIDEPYWRVFEAGGSPYYTYFVYVTPSRRSVTEVRVTWNPPSNQELCFVFDNKFSTTTSKTVRAEITASYEGYPAIRYRVLGYLLAPGVLVLVAGATLLAASWYASPRQKPAGAQH